MLKSRPRRAPAGPRWSHILGAVAFAAALLGDGRARAEFAPGLCLVNVPDAPPAVQHDFLAAHPLLTRPWYTSILTHDVTLLPGMPQPILYPYPEGQHAWTISDQNTVEAFQGPFPGSHFWDQFAVDTTGRVLGMNPRGLYAFDPTTHQFRQLATAPLGHGLGQVVSTTDFRDVNTLLQVGRLHMTLIGTDNGLFRVVGDQAEPVPGAGRAQVGTVVYITDLPVHKALLLSGSDHTWLRHDDGTVEMVLDTGNIDHAVESPTPGKVLLPAARKVVIVPMHPSTHGFSPGVPQTLDSSSTRNYPNDITTPSGAYLLFGRSGWWSTYGLERLEADGLHPVPGPVMQADTYGISMTRIPSRGLVLIQDKVRLYLYDGTAVKPIPDSAPGQIGTWVQPTDLPSIGKVLLRLNKSLVELTPNGGLVPFLLPFDYESAHPTLGVLPSAHVGLIATPDNLWAIEPDGRVLSIEGAGQTTYPPSTWIGVIPVRNMMLVRRNSGLSLLSQATRPDAPCTEENPSKAP